MPKEYIYGSDKSIPGYGMIAASAYAAPEEKKWVSNSSVYVRIGSKEESPVSFIFTRAGENCFLSRIFPSIDYTGRACFTANYLELSQEEVLLYEDGPVYVLERYRFMPPTPNPPLLARNEQQFINRFDGCRDENARCNIWQSMLAPLGLDGRILAGTAVLSILRGKPFFLIYEKEQKEQILALFREVWALLPASLRWKYTFNTYLPNLGTVYSLNGVLKDSEPCSKLHGIPGCLRLNLTTGEHNVPSEMTDVSSLYGLERYFLTNCVTDAQAAFGPMADLPTPASDSWESQNELLLQSQNQLEAVREEIASEIHRLNAELTGLKETSQKYKANAERMKNELETLKTSIQEKTTEYQRLENDIQSNKSYSGQLNEWINAKTSELENLKQTIVQLTSQKSDLESTVQNLRNQQADLLASIQQAEYSKTTLEEALPKLNQQKNSLAQEIGKLMSAKPVLSQQVENLEKEKAELESAVQTLKQCVDKMKLAKNMNQIIDFCTKVSNDISKLKN